MTKDQLERHNSLLLKALRALVYQDDGGRYRTGIIGDSDVTEEVKAALEYKPRKRRTPT